MMSRVHEDLPKDSITQTAPEQQKASVTDDIQIAEAELRPVKSKEETPETSTPENSGRAKRDSTPVDPETAKKNAELLAKRRASLIGKTVSGRLKPSHFGAKKGYFVKWNENDADTIFISKVRIEQHLGPDPKPGMFVKCTIVDLGPEWAAWDRQHPYTQAVVPCERPARLSRSGSIRSMSSITTLPTAASSTPRASVTTSPRQAAKESAWKSIKKAMEAGKLKTEAPAPIAEEPAPISDAQAELAAKSWKIIQDAILNQKLPGQVKEDSPLAKAAALKSWDVVKDALLKQATSGVVEDKRTLPRNRRSSAFACRQHRRSDMGGANRSWRRGSNTTSASVTPEDSRDSSPRFRGDRRDSNSAPNSGRGTRAPVRRSSSTSNLLRGGIIKRAPTATNSRFGSLR